MTRSLLLAVTFLLGASVMLFSSCGYEELKLDISLNEPIVLDPLPTLLGDYQGIYVYTADYGMVNEQPPAEFPITWRFTDHSYHCWDNSAEGEDCICDPSGEYTVADGVELIMREDGCAGCVFDSSKLPEGFFSLRQPPDPQTGKDSVVLTQIIGDIRKDIRLARQE